MDRMERRTGWRRCLVCGAELGHLGVCSVACATAAQREAATNAERLRTSVPALSPAHRYALAVRNGQLMAAVLTFGGAPGPVGLVDLTRLDDHAATP